MPHLPGPFVTLFDSPHHPTTHTQSITQQLSLSLFDSFTCVISLPRRPGTATGCAPNWTQAAAAASASVSDCAAVHLAFNSASPLRTAGSAGTSQCQGLLTFSRRLSTERGRERGEEVQRWRTIVKADRRVREKRWMISRARKSTRKSETWQVHFCQR